MHFEDLDDRSAYVALPAVGWALRERQVRVSRETDLPRLRPRRHRDMLPRAAIWQRLRSGSAHDIFDIRPSAACVLMRLRTF
jgi:hypothetical protein